MQQNSTDILFTKQTICKISNADFHNPSQFTHTTFTLEIHKIKVEFDTKTYFHTYNMQHAYDLRSPKLNLTVSFTNSQNQISKYVFKTI